MMQRARTAIVWALIAAAIALPLAASLTSPLLAWRDPIYIIAGAAGVAGMSLMLMQPLLASRRLPGISAQTARWLHRWGGSALIVAVFIHVAGLWITSPPDVFDALTFTSATPFAAWGVIAMWAICAAALLVAARRRLRWRAWRRVHSLFAAIIVASTIGHALLIDGTMEPVSKALLSAVLGVASFAAIVRHW